MKTMLFLLFFVANLRLFSNDTIKIENYTIIKVLDTTVNNSIIKGICIEKLKYDTKKLHIVIYDANDVIIRDVPFHKVNHKYYKFKENAIRIQLYYKDEEIIWDSLLINISDEFKIVYKTGLKLCEK